MFNHSPVHRALVMTAVVVFGTAAMTAEVAASEISEARTPGAVTWATDFSWDHAVLTVSGPAGVRAWALGPQAPLSFGVDTLTAWSEAAGAPLEGAYTYELVFTPRLSDEEAAERARMRDPDDGLTPGAPTVALLPKRSGTFRIMDGTIVGAASSPSEPQASAKDVLHYDDVIVTGSLCVGFDCANGYSFGFDSIALREDNLRIFFDDGSDTASYPRNDWRITINDNTNGGASYFGIDDVTEGTSPFRIEAGAPSSSLYVEDYGRVGLGTSVPVVELHIKDSDTPTVRLEQDSSGGWTAQTWDLAGNESNFFIRDATNGSKLPFRIQPNTPSSTLNLKSDGKVGIGTWSPAAKLEVEATGEPATLLLDQTDGGRWYLTSMADGTFTIGTSDVEGEELVILDQLGNLTTSGTVNGVSDRALKSGLQPVNVAAVLDALMTLEVSEWRLTADPAGARHLGPTAQDFRDRFGLGADERHISLSDLGGVAIAAIQGLAARLEERERTISELERRLAALEERLALSH
jgi:hypothetical protein